ncbi:MAG: hypothetical protein VCB99_11935, partial [Myxococcota bacterium]
MSDETPTPKTTAPAWQRALPWLVTLGCFTYLYFRIDGAAAREGSSAIPYLAKVFANVSWTRDRKSTR